MDDALEFIELRASLRLLTKWQKLTLRTASPALAGHPDKWS